jgi:hypothetical protein
VRIVLSCIHSVCQCIYDSSDASLLTMYHACLRNTAVFHKCGVHIVCHIRFIVVALSVITLDCAT